MADHADVGDDVNGMDGVDSRRPLVDRQSNSCSDTTVTPDGREPMTYRQKLVILTICLSNFGIGVFYSMLGPFFPIEAAKKGLSSVLIGFVFGVYELMFFISSPIFGIFLTQLGAKFTFLTGLLSCGYCTIVFGFLDYSPPGVTYAALCFAVRVVEGLGAAAMTTSSFAIIAHSFPTRVTTLIGSLELFSGIGMMTGPLIGGWLYQLGGFRLPFLTSGSVLIAIGVATAFILPSSDGLHESDEEPQGSLLTLVRLPLVLVASWLMICASSSLGLIDIGLAPVLSKQLGLSPWMTGLMFLIGPAGYAFGGPFWGMMADKIPKYSIWLLVGGYIAGGFSFMLLGPSPFLHLGPLKLWMVIVSQLIMGFGLGTMVIGFQLYTIAARQCGMPDSLHTYGLLSGIFTSAFSFGAFLGPVVSGAMLDKIGFPWTSTVVGFIILASALVAVVYKICAGICTRSHPVVTVTDERSPLLSSPTQ